MHDAAPSPAAPPRAAPPADALSVRARAVLDALCARFTGRAGDVSHVTRAVERRLAGEPVLRAQVERALRLFDHPLTGLVLSARPRRFTALGPDAQHAALESWSASRIGSRHALVEALRRIVLSTAYALPAEAAAIGHLGPLHLRQPAFDWEGPAPGQGAGDAEPVARRAGSTLAPPPFAPVPQRAAPPAAGDVLRADACVVGSGAGGGVVAARLSEAGLHVVVLEEGGWWTPAQFTEDESEMVPRLYADAGMRATADLGVALLQGRCVGGGTTVNWMIMLRPPSWVMEEWAHDHGAELLGPDQLVPALERIEHEVHARLVPDDAHSPANRIILDGAARLGWHAEPARINAAGCVRAGTCGLGCRYRAKRGILETYLPRALAAGARVIADARVDHVEHAASLGRVKATVLDADTRRPRGSFTVQAPIVVLAAGAVGTPVILQRSGLGGGAVGRYLRLHPTTGVLGRYPSPMYQAAGIPQSAICDEFLEDNGGYGFWIECPPLLPGLGAAGLPGFGAEHRALIEDYPRLAALIVLVRDGVERDRSRGDVLARGRRVRVRYRLGPGERRTLARGIHAAVQLHRAAGAQDAITLHRGARPMTAGAEIDWILRATGARNRIQLFSAHVNGTCRMGVDPRTSGCDPNGQRHGVPGLFIADGSILPSAPGANPQALIMAAASSIAERIIATRPGA